jgi:nicotinate-nucleotide pyrophosphorylase (carboxylating)
MYGSTGSRPRDLDAEVGELIDLALTEDVGDGDVSTLWTVDEADRFTARITAKQHLVLSGLGITCRVFLTVDPDVRILGTARDGDTAESGDVVLEVEGPARALLTAERTAVNFLGRLSGIATLTRRFVDAVRGTGARIIDTRKTTPGWRMLEKKAVRDGGGTNHRMGLYDMVMIKDNHIAAAGGIEAAVARVRQANDRGLAVEVEVTTIHELIRALPLGVDRVLLDNMPLETLREAVRRVEAAPPPRPETEASGNVLLGTVRSIAETGVDYISVGALTHSAPNADLSMRVIR